MFLLCKDTHPLNYKWVKKCIVVNFHWYYLLHLSCFGLYPQGTAYSRFLLSMSKQDPWHLFGTSYIFITQSSLLQTKCILFLLVSFCLLKNRCFPLHNFFHSLGFMLESYAHNIFTPSCPLIMILKILYFMQLTKFYTNAFIFYLFKLENNSRSYLVICLRLISFQDFHISAILFSGLCKIKWWNSLIILVTSC